MNEEKNNIQRSLGRIEGQLKANTNIIKELKQDIKKIGDNTKEIPVLKKEILNLKNSFNNHLEHHKIKSDRWFKFISYVIGGVIIGLLTYLITLMH